MAYIQPNTYVYLLRGVEIDSDYHHTYYFANASAQYSFFISKVKPTTHGHVFSLSEYTYQRANKNTIRVGIPADDLYDCNYMMFQNTSYGSKWFYAFIREVNYINDNTTEIVYMVDDMQTWYFDYELGESYIDREHADHDAVGDNLVPEQIDGGELIVQDKWDYTYPNNYEPTNTNMFEFLVWYIPNRNKDDDNYGKAIGEYHPASGGNEAFYDLIDSQEKSIGDIINGVYTGAYVYNIEFKIDELHLEETRAKINLLIYTMVDIGCSIVNMYEVPQQVWLNWFEEDKYSTNLSAHYQTSRYWNVEKTSYHDVVNKKLMTYPYQQIIVSNNDGGTSTIMWENFKTANSAGQKKAEFTVDGVPSPTCELLCYPRNYRGISDDYESGIALTSFPQCSWSEDSYARWVQQNQDALTTNNIASAVNIGITALVTAIGVALTAGTGGAGAPATGALIAGLAGAGGVAHSTTNLISNNVAAHQTARKTPDSFHGQVGLSSLRNVEERVGFTFYAMGIRKEAAEIVDKYFTMYGYATHKVKVPNTHVRTRFTYTKTIGCIVHAKDGKGLPADAEAKISSIFDNGITFWVSTATVGDYTSSNDIIL